MGISQIQGFNDLQIGRLKVGKIQNFQIGKFVHLGGLEISRLMDLKIQKCEEWDAPKFGGLKKIKRLEIWRFEENSEICRREMITNALKKYVE